VHASPYREPAAIPARSIPEAKPRARPVVDDELPPPWIGDAHSTECAPEMLAEPSPRLTTIASALRWTVLLWLPIAFAIVWALLFAFVLR
jgi:hypothetical protein